MAGPPTKLMIEPLVQYMAARQAATDAKRAGGPQPWSADPVIAEKILCSVVRDDDRTSLEARRIILGVEDPERRSRAVRCFRFFNHIPTLEAILPHLDEGDGGTILEILRSLPKVYNQNAYRVNTRRGLWNLEGLVELICLSLAAPEPVPSAQETWQALVRATSSPFICYQIMQDMRWLHGPYADESKWCLVGIGAWRGYCRLLGTYTARNWAERWQSRPPVGRGGGIPEEMLPVLQSALQAARSVLGDHINMMEIEHNLCEFDKYERMRTGESKGRRYRPQAG